MKLIIVLKQTDADGYGGQILETMGMKRSAAEPAVFAMTSPVHATDKLGHGDSSWSQPEATTQVYIEALTDAGIRPMRVFQRSDSTAGLTPIHAAAWADTPDPIDTDDLEVEDAMAAVGLGPIPGDEEYDGEDSIQAAMKAVELALSKLKGAENSKVANLTIEVVMGDGVNEKTVAARAIKAANGTPGVTQALLKGLKVR